MGLETECDVIIEHVMTFNPLTDLFAGAVSCIILCKGQLIKILTQGVELK